MPQSSRALLLSFLFVYACASAPALRHPAQSAIPTPGPELAKELKLFDAKNMYPADRPDGSTEGYYGWADCFTMEYNRAPVRLNGSELRGECRPDTLYSWQGQRALDGLKAVATGARWKDSFPQGPLYTHVNPVATYAYGLNALRLKLKPTTKFKVFLAQPGREPDYCGGALKPAEKNDTVAVRLFNGGTDYILCSPQVIESWSFDSKTQYDEIVVSALWYFRQAARHDWIPYRNFFPAAEGEAPSPLFISDEEGRDFDGHSFTEDQLAQQLAFLRKDAGAGSFYYAPGVPADPARHFATAKPIYWNRRAASAASTAATASPANAGNGITAHRDNACGFGLAYPSALFSEEGSGAFSARAMDGKASFYVECEASKGKSLKALYAERVEEDGNVSYKTMNAAKGSFVGSGKRGQMIFYTKSILVGATLKTLFITYDQAARDPYDGVAAEIAKSFVGAP